MQGDFGLIINLILPVRVKLCTHLYLKRKAYRLALDGQDDLEAFDVNSRRGGAGMGHGCACSQKSKLVFARDQVLSCEHQFWNLTSRRVAISSPQLPE